MKLAFVFAVFALFFACIRAGQTQAEEDEPRRPPLDNITLLWSAPFYSGGGYCSEAHDFVQGLAEIFDVGIQQHGDSYNREYVNKLQIEKRQLLGELDRRFRDVTAWGFQRGDRPIISVCHSEPGAWHPPRYSTSRCPPKIATYKVGRTMFETDRLPAAWADKITRTVDEVWVPTSFHRRIFADNGVQPWRIHVIGEAVDTEFFDKSKALPHFEWGEHVLPIFGEGQSITNPVVCKRKYVSIFKWEKRKGYDVLLQAFDAEFSKRDGACLFIKTQAYHSSLDFDKLVRDALGEARARQEEVDERERGERRERKEGGGGGKEEEEEEKDAKKKRSEVKAEKEKWYPNIFVITSFLSPHHLRDLYHAADALVIPSRGEGWGRPHSEAMAMSKPVIATRWSGNLEFMSDDNSLLIDVEEMEEIESGAFRGHKWARPSVQSLRRHLRTVYNMEEAEAEEMGKRARATMEKYTISSIANKVKDRVMAILEEQRTGYVHRGVRDDL